MNSSNLVECTVCLPWTTCWSEAISSWARRSWFCMSCSRLYSATRIWLFVSFSSWRTPFNSCANFLQSSERENHRKLLINTPIVDEMTANDTPSFCKNNSFNFARCASNSSRNVLLSNSSADNFFWRSEIYHEFFSRFCYRFFLSSTNQFETTHLRLPNRKHLHPFFSTFFTLSANKHHN